MGLFSFLAGGGLPAYAADSGFRRSANGFLFGQQDKAKQFNRYTPQQNEAFSQLYEALGMNSGPFNDVYGQFNPQQTNDFFQNAVANPSMRNFQQQVLPAIQQRFADQGPSSGLYNSLATAGRDFSENLSSQLANYMYQAQMQNQQNRAGGLNSFLQNSPYQTYVQAGNPGIVPSLVSQFAGGAGRAAGAGMF